MTGVLNAIEFPNSTTLKCFMLKSINKYLSRWVAAGFLTEEQANAIRQHEEQHKAQKSWAVYGMALIGAVSIAIGVVSIIAANWDQLSGSAKLTGYLLIQAALSYAVFACRDEKPLMREVFLGLNAGFVLAGIGLVAQVFHLVSNGWSGLLFWCVLTLPMVLFSQHRPLPNLWVAMLLATEAIWYGKTLDQLPAQSVSAVTNMTFLVILSLYAICALGFYARDRGFLPKYFSEALRLDALCVIFIGGTIYGNIVWYAGADMILREIPNMERAAFMRLQFAPWVGALILVPVFLKRLGQSERRLSLAMASLLVNLAFFVTAPVMFNLESSKWLATFLTVLLWWHAAIAAIYADKKRLFDFLTFAIAARLLFVYFEIFGSMLATGLGLIITGALILAVAYVWYKHRDRLACWLGGRTA